MRRTKLMALLGCSLLALAACKDDHNDSGGSSGGKPSDLPPPHEN